MNDTAVIVVSYNTRDLTLQAVASARKASDGLDARVIVADNGSADGTVEAVRAAYPEVTVLENPDNPGYGAAINRAASAQRSTHLCAMNADVVLEPGSLLKLRRFLAMNRSCGLVGPALAYPDGKPQRSAKRFPTLGLALGEVLALHALAPGNRWVRRFYYGIDAATGEWILIVDADELMPEKLVRCLEEHIGSNPAAAGFWIPRMNYFVGLPVPHTSGFPDYQLRCFRRGAGRFPDRLHGAAAIDGHVAYLPVEDGAWIVHDRKGTTLTDVVLKFDTYASKEARTQLGDGRAFGGPLAALWAGFSAFRFRFITSRGYRDGMAGLLLSVLFGFYRFLVEAKAWELSGFESRWDCDVRRLGSLRVLVWNLAREAARRIRGRTRPTRAK